MPDSVRGFDEMPLYDLPVGPASIRKTAGRRRLLRRFLRASRRGLRRPRAAGAAALREPFGG